uniref:hypothetical protein n=1 Tax=Nocardia suismassiliense TaxID=2077092 RepID=UPI003F49400F
MSDSGGRLTFARKSGGDSPVSPHRHRHDTTITQVLQIAYVVTSLAAEQVTARELATGSAVTG